MDPPGDRTTIATSIGKDGREAGCGCQAIGLLVAVPVALECVALALIWFGPGSGRLWALKAILVAAGGLLLVLGRIAHLVAAVSRNTTLPEPLASLGPYVTIADALSGPHRDIV